MPLEARLPAFLERLRKAAFFEDGAESTVRAMLDASKEALDVSRFAHRGRLLRGMAHLRPAEGYRSLVAVDLARGGGASHLPSATAWRWLAKHGCPVSLDVHMKSVQLHREGEPTPVDEQSGPLGGFESPHTLEKLMGRAATHLLAIPLRAQGGAIEGMISLEADCRPAMGQPFIFDACEELQILADVAAPYLLGLPLRPAPATGTDEHLPVIGKVMARTVQLAKVFAEQNETILISGPTGAGKSRLARWCHERSPRRASPFEKVDLRAVPDTLQLGELFGWRKGAFSTALKDRRGAVARAEGGTLFIDEIDKLSLEAQSGLLQLLEERTYRAFGDEGAPRSADVRFLIGTNVDLLEAVRNGQFREDLYFRINVLPVRMPALEERVDEVPLWARYMTERRHRDASREGRAQLSASAERLLSDYHWRGNLRQLDNVIRRAYALALSDLEGSSGDIAIAERHVAQALGFERGAQGRALIEAMRHAAEAFVAEAERVRGREGEGSLDLDHSDALRGFVLGTAVRKLGTPEAAYKLMGKEALVESRNQRKAFRRAMEKVQVLCRVLDGERGSPFADLLDEDET